MDESRTTESDELFDTDSSEELSPNTSNTYDSEAHDEDDDAELLSSEEREEALELKESTSAKDEAKKRQLNAWLKKINNGEKSLADLPKNQKWLKPELERALRVSQQTQKLEADYDIDEIVERKLAEKEDNREFKLIKASLNDADLTPSQKSDVSEEYTDLRAAGLSKAKALQKAIKIAGIKATDALAEAMMPPRPSTKREKAVDGDNWWQEGTSESRIDKLAELTDPTAGISKKFR